MISVYIYRHCGEPDRPTWHVTFQHSPAVGTRSTANIKTGPKLREHGRQRTFGEDVGILQRSGNVQDADFTEDDSFSDEVQVDLNMLGSLMLDQVGGEINSTDIVTIDHCSTTKWAAKLLQKLA
jgi:hypothetical protein